jgi:hypothetical protein
VNTARAWGRRRDPLPSLAEFLERLAAEERAFHRRLAWRRAANALAPVLLALLAATLAS